MTSAAELTTTLLPGAARLLELHARALPQRDDLCGAFCGALSLGAAGLERAPDGGPLDQDAVALAAGSVVSSTPRPSILPHGESGRRDYRLEIPTIADGEESGTTAAGVLEALERLSDGALAVLPFSGPWTPSTLGALFDAAAAVERPASLIANFATHHLWGSRASVTQRLAYLLEGIQDGPPPDWRVGHFACVVARVRGPEGDLYAVADTYPALGNGGVHMQPRERLAAAVDRRDMPAGGVLAVLASEDADAVRAAATAAGLREEMWDNGTVAPEGETPT